MKLPSFFKKQRKTLKPGFRSYKSSLRRIKRKPIKIKRQKIKSPSTRINKRSFQKKQRIFLALKGATLLIAISSVGYFLFLTPFLEIQKIQITGSSETLDEEAALNIYLQDYLGDNILLFPAIKHENALLSDFPYLQTLDIKRKLPRTLSVTLQPHPQAANIKITLPGEEFSYFIINDLGYISSIGITDKLLPTIVMDITGTEEKLDINANIIPEEMLNTLLEVNKGYEGKFNMNIIEINYLKRAREVHLYTERDFSVWIDLTQDVNEQLAKLKKAMTKLNLYEADLEYIDLRISGQNGEKVIYKLKGDI